MSNSKPRSANRPTGNKQGLGMLVFESLSAGGIAVFVALAGVLILVGTYSYFVWPFTHWDLANVKLGNGSWWEYALGLIFAAGSAIGFWCFSGAAWRGRAGQRRESVASRAR